MNTALATRPAPRPLAASPPPLTPTRRFLGVVTRPQSYRSIGYLLVGLPLATIWFAVLVTGLSVAASMVVVALLGVPMLLGMVYVVRAFANVERRLANVLLDRDLPLLPLATGQRGNVWVRLRSLGAQPHRWRELGYLLLRLPVAIATFIVAVTALTTSVAVAYAPIHIRFVDDPFGDWFWSSELEGVARSPWSWLLVPLGVGMLLVAFHLVNALARVSGEWTAAWLGAQPTLPASTDTVRS